MLGSLLLLVPILYMLFYWKTVNPLLETMIYTNPPYNDCKKTYFMLFFSCNEVLSELCSQKCKCLWPAGCEKTTNSYLWLFVLMGNLLRGIGEAPVMPLGVSYIDDFSKEENSAFYIGNMQMSDFYAKHSFLSHFCSQANTHQKKKSICSVLDNFGLYRDKKAMQKGSHVYFRRIFPRCFPQLASATHASFLCDNISL